MKFWSKSAFIKNRGSVPTMVSPSLSLVIHRLLLSRKWGPRDTCAKGRSLWWLLQWNSSSSSVPQPREQTTSDFGMDAREPKKNVQVCRISKALVTARESGLQWREQSISCSSMTATPDCVVEMWIIENKKEIQAKRNLKWRKFTLLSVPANWVFQSQTPPARRQTCSATFLPQNPSRSSWNGKLGLENQWGWILVLPLQACVTVLFIKGPADWMTSSWTASKDYLNFSIFCRSRF